MILFHLAFYIQCYEAHSMEVYSRSMQAFLQPTYFFILYIF